MPVHTSDATPQQHSHNDIEKRSVLSQGAHNLAEQGESK